MFNNAIRSLARAAAVAALGALAGAICLVGAYTMRPDVTIEMDRDLPRGVSGLYQPERDGELTFAWTSGKTDVRLPGFDRTRPWICSLRFRGGRAAPLPQPTVRMSVDGITLGTRLATNDYQDLEVTVPTRDRPGMTLTIAAEPTAVPGPNDPRELGVQADRFTCRPEPSGLALPPRRAITRAMLTAAAFGAGFALLGITVGSAIGATLLVAAAQAIPFSTGFAPYGPYPGQAVRLAVWISLLMVVALHGLQWWNRRPLRQTARFVVAFVAAALYLKLAALIHPSKPLIDAVFQAHRLELVLAGRYFFTQPMPGGVTFPYAIALYVFSAPWSALTRDFVTLLRVVVCATEAIAGALLYVMFVRARGDRLAGALAVALFSVVPLAFWFIGNANLPNAFGQAVALIAVATAVLLPLQPRQPAHWVLLVAIISLALLSHIGTFAILVATLFALAALYWLLGGPALRGAAVRLLAATVVAVAVAVASYYGHFGDVYQRALKVRADAASTAPPVTAGAKTVAVSPLHERVYDALFLTKEAIGVPVILLAAIGAASFWAGHVRDRLALAVIAWGVA